MTDVLGQLMCVERRAHTVRDDTEGVLGETSVWDLVVRYNQGSSCKIEIALAIDFPTAEAAFEWLKDPVVIRLPLVRPD